MPLYPYYPSARANADRYDLADWVISDFPTFEKAHNSGASAYRPAAPWGSEIIKTAGPKAPSPAEINRFLHDDAGLTFLEAARLSARALDCGASHPEDRSIVMGIRDNEPGTITREEDAALRRMGKELQNDRAVPKVTQKYNDAFRNGKLRLIP